MSTEQQCYNLGCGKKFDPERNKDESCIFHPGRPVFHDAMKGWSCCSKRSTDFTTCLSFPGCAKGRHSNVKPEEPKKEKTENAKEKIEVKQQTRPPQETRVPMERPSPDEELIVLKAVVAQSLKSSWEKEKSKSEGSESKEDSKSCKNNGCDKSYIDESSNTEICRFHPGAPMFHEGLKFWTCCKKRTTEFSEFLSQKGCQEGKHVWKKEGAKKAACRYDFFETGSNITISVYCKMTVPEKTEIKVNQVVCHVKVVFDKGVSQFEQKFNLKGIINPAKSSVKLMGPKVEITLCKAEPGSWSTLELPMKDISLEEEKES
ncbi:DgyrCDS1825 [Dimorphilus gyrociliatus]|uniref:DgyrCDS1825 n=1 Tax=Dimorphilus gyrociliatus TaxID=2664684 RepID=A0A7I8V8I9_9ANNE|nr:DgyrCDS1825 [Dimorphilus gyrociliatus]